MIYLLQNENNKYAIVSSDRKAAGWDRSIGDLDLSLRATYNIHINTSLETELRTNKHKILATYNNIEEFKQANLEHFL